MRRCRRRTIEERISSTRRRRGLRPVDVNDLLVLHPSHHRWRCLLLFSSCALPATYYHHHDGTPLLLTPAAAAAGGRKKKTKNPYRLQLVVATSLVLIEVVILDDRLYDEPVACEAVGEGHEVSRL